MKKILIGVFTVIILSVITFFSTQLYSIPDMLARIGVLERSIPDMKREINDIHWFLIKKNNVKVPLNK